MGCITSSNQKDVVPQDLRESVINRSTSSTSYKSTHQLNDNDRNLEDDSEVYDDDTRDIDSIKIVRQHFYPPDFPVSSGFSQKDLDSCQVWWKQMLDPDNRNVLVFFIDTFYEQLFQENKRCKSFFKELFTRYQILIHVMNFVVRKRSKKPIKNEQKYITKVIELHFKLHPDPRTYCSYIRCIFKSLRITYGKLMPKQILLSWMYLLNSTLHTMISGIVVDMNAVNLFSSKLVEEPEENKTFDYLGVGEDISPASFSSTNIGVSKEEFLGGGKITEDYRESSKLFQVVNEKTHIKRNSTCEF